MLTTARLRRDLTLWDLILYGIVIVQPIAPVPLFGITQVDSRGHAVLTILIGMVAMLFTAVSYGRMAALYPSAGSAYTYVGRGLNPYLGFLAGWGMLLCYLLFPVINIVYVAVTLHEYRAKLWPERDQHRALTRRYSLLPGRKPGDRRRHRIVSRVFVRSLPVLPCHRKCRDVVAPSIRLTLSVGDP